MDRQQARQPLPPQAGASALIVLNDDDLHYPITVIEGSLISGMRTAAHNEIILLNPMGMAIEDIACTQAIYQWASAADVGTWLPLE